MSYLLSHKSGVALWEVWLPAPDQPFDAARWIDWLDPEAEDSLVARLWRRERFAREFAANLTEADTA